MVWELKRLSLWEMWRDGLERILRSRVWVRRGFLLLLLVVVNWVVLERVLVMDATVSSSETWVRVESGDFDGVFIVLLLRHRTVSTCAAI